MVDIKAVQEEVRKADEEKAKAKSGFQRGYGGAHGHEESGIFETFVNAICDHIFAFQLTCE